ncbi:MAG: transglycosylase SLT domain-containing protein [Betaproteobacteria bacterium]
MNALLSNRFCATLAALLVGAFTLSPVCAQNPADADIVAARLAFDRGDAKQLASIAPKVQNHVLAPYVRFWQLELALDTVDAETVHVFLRQWAGTPIGDRLAVDWLKSRARAGDWTGFAIEYPPRATGDTELACAAVQFRRQRDGDAALADAKPLWFSGQATPEACEPLFAALIASKDITEDDRIARVRLAIESGNQRLTRALADALPGAARVKAAEFAAIDRDPQRALARGKFNWKSRSDQILALYALERAARSDAGAAHKSWVQWRARLPAEARGYGNARIAYLGARQLEADANAWYAEADISRQNADERAWHVRAALRAGDWPAVLAAVDALPAGMADDAAWRYWRARALERLDRRDEALPIYAALAPQYNFYGILAAEAIGKRPVTHSTPAPVTTSWLADFGARNDVQRVVKLAQLDMRADSVREWYEIVRAMDDETLLKAAEFARRAGLSDRSINAADRTVARHDFALRYPTPYEAQFLAAAKMNNVEAPLLYGIARQESRFVADIVSSAGAMGLMQLMPPTARWVSKQLNRAGYRAEAITEIDTNSQFGAFYLKYWLDRLDGQPALAAAAYNAGPGRAQAWRPPAAMEGAIWVETIPFNETRDYVKKVMANTMFYAGALPRRDAPYVSLTERLGTVRPRNAAAAVAQSG